jgi:hypothetical protein
MVNESDREKALIQEARDFLHAISNKVMIADGMADAVFSALTTTPNIDGVVITRLQKAVTALKTLSQMIKDERSRLVSAEAGRDEKS